MAMLLSKRVLRMLALVLALVATSFSVKMRTAEAEPRIIDCDYYSDATYTTVVGSYTKLCNGQIVIWGTQTPYARCHNEYC